MSSLSIFVHDTVVISDAYAIEILLVKISNYLTFTAKELAELRDALRMSIGNHADTIDENSLAEFGTSMLLATSVVLKAKYNLKNSK